MYLFVDPDNNHSFVSPDAPTPDDVAFVKSNLLHVFRHVDGAIEEIQPDGSWTRVQPGSIVFEPVTKTHVHAPQKWIDQESAE